MLSRAKDIAHSTWTWLKKYGPATAFSGGRLASSAGGVVLNAETLADKAYQVYSHTPSATAPQSIRIPVQFASVLSNIWVNLITRIPPLFRYLSEVDSDASYKAEALGEAENLFDEIDEETGWFSSWTRPEFDTKWNGVLIFVRIMLYVSLSFMFLNTVFNSMKLYELFLQLFTSVIDQSTFGLVVEIIFALFASASNVMVTLSLNIPASLANTIEAIKNVRKGDIKLTPALAATACLGLLNMIALVFGSYYQTGNMFERFKKMMGFLNTLLSETTTKIIILLSTSGGVVADTTSRLFSLYRLIVKWGTKLRDYCYPAAVIEESVPPTDAEPLPSYWMVLKTITIILGMSDAGFAGLLNLNSIPYLLAQLTSIDPENGAVTAFAIGTGFSTAAMTFAFTWEASNQTEERLRASIEKSARIARLEQVVMNDDSADEARPFIANESHGGIKFFDAVEPSAHGILDSSGESSSGLDSDSDSGSGYSKLIQEVGEQYKL